MLKLIQACCASGSSGGTEPAVAFKSKRIQPKGKGAGRLALPTTIRPASAGKGKTEGDGCTACSCSSKTTILACRCGYQAGAVPHAKAPSWTLESRQIVSVVVPLVGPVFW